MFGMGVLGDSGAFMVSGKLAQAVGLPQAIILQRVQFEASMDGTTADGHRWIRRSMAAWQEVFPFWSERTILRHIRGLEQSGLLMSRADLNPDVRDTTKWYRVNHDELNQVKVA